MKTIYTKVFAANAFASGTVLNRSRIRGNVPRRTTGDTVDIFTECPFVIVYEIYVRRSVTIGCLNALAISGVCGDLGQWYRNRGGNVRRGTKK